MEHHWRRQVRKFLRNISKEKQKTRVSLWSIEDCPRAELGVLEQAEGRRKMDKKVWLEEPRERVGNGAGEQELV